MIGFVQTMDSEKDPRCLVVDRVAPQVAQARKLPPWILSTQIQAGRGGALGGERGEKGREGEGSPLGLSATRHLRVMRQQVRTHGGRRVHGQLEFGVNPDCKVGAREEAVGQHLRDPRVAPRGGKRERSPAVG